MSKLTPVVTTLEKFMNHFLKLETEAANRTTIEGYEEAIQHAHNRVDADMALFILKEYIATEEVPF